MDIHNTKKNLIGGPSPGLYHFIRRSVPIKSLFMTINAVAVAQWVREFAPQAEGWVFESQPRKTQVIKTGSDSYNAKHSALGATVTGPRIWPW